MESGLHADTRIADTPATKQSDQNFNPMEEPMKFAFPRLWPAIGLVLILAAAPVVAQELKLPRTSPSASVSQTIGTTEVTITYCRPGVKGREIWGGLVPYDKVWRAGANEATTISFSDPVTIEGQKLDAGTYALFTIPTPNTWTVVFNKKADQWGAYTYKQDEDALRVTVTPHSGNEVEWMRFVFTGLSDSGATVELQWAKLRVPFKIGVDTEGKILDQAEKLMSRQWVMPYQAANFFMSKGTHLDKALLWADLSATIQPTYYNLALKARLLAQDGQTAKAIAAMEEAIAKGKAMKQAPGNLAESETLLAKWKGQ